jgi:hypothetical protein
VTVTVEPLDGRKAPAAPADLDGWFQDLAPSADGSELLVMMQQSLTRLRLSDGARRETRELFTIGVNKLHASPDGRVIFFERYNEVDVRAAANLEPICKLYPLLTGGWLAVSAAGGVDGSPDAPDATITRATFARETLITSGRTAWDRFHAPGTYRRALAGEAVAAARPALSAWFAGR